VPRPDRFTCGERVLGTHWIRGWVGPRAGLDEVENRKISCPYRESSPGRSGLDTPTDLSRLHQLSSLGSWISVTVNPDRNTKNEKFCSQLSKAVPVLTN
jgi:hypothetical protein